MKNLLNNSPLQNAIEELREAIANNYSAAERAPLFEKISQEAEKPANLNHKNARNETGIGALWHLFNEIKHTAKSDKKYIEKILASKIGEEKVRVEIANQEATKATPMTTFEMMKTKILISQGAKNQMLFDAIRNNDMVGISNALKIGANVEARMDKTGDTPLILASRIGRIEPAITLIDANANVNAKNYAGQNALHVAHPGELIQNNQGRDSEMVDLLWSANVDINAVDIHGRTPLMTAESYENAKALFNAGAKYDHENIQEFWKNEGKEEIALDFQSFYKQNNRVYEKSEETAAEENTQQSEAAYEQQGRSV